MTKRHINGVLGIGIVATLGGCPLLPSGISPIATEIRLELLTEGLPTLVGAIFPDDGSGRALLVGQAGQVLVRGADGTIAGTPFLDLRDRMITLDDSYDERGLVGLALHPDFVQNGRVYAVYSAPTDDPLMDSELRLSEFSALPDLAMAPAESERMLLRIPKAEAGHNAGQLQFGPDGYLYVSVGDGGFSDGGDSVSAEVGNSQNRAMLLGKILRIDVDNGDPYAIPSDNPFVGDPSTRSEIFALGLRNPWRFSFDVEGGVTRLFVGDVGQSLREEINLVTAGGNYGWRVREGTTCVNLDALSFPLDGCADSDANGEKFTDPIIEYDRSIGRAVTGGYVYRGNRLRALRGKYVFGDFSAALLTPDGRFFAATESASGRWSFRELAVENREGGTIGEYLYSFAEDTDHELYVITNDSVSPTGAGAKLYRIVEAE